MRHRRFIDLRSMFKLNDNITTKKKGEDGYDPCGTYEMIWDVMCHNMNAFIETAKKDVTIDESSWSHMGFGSEALGCVYGKPGICKGGQTTIAVSAKRRYLLAYHHRHRLQKRYAPFTQQGPAEIKSLMDKMDPIIQGNAKSHKDKRRQIFVGNPCLIFDNHFSRDYVMEYIGQKG